MTPYQAGRRHAADRRPAGLRIRALVVLAVCSLAAASDVSAQTRQEFKDRDGRRDALRRAETAQQTQQGATVQRAVASALTVTSISRARESDDTVSYAGEVQNATGTTLTFGRVTIAQFSGATQVGNQETFIFAPQNVRLSASGQFTDALPPGAVGFFKTYTSANYDSVTSYSVSTVAEEFAITPAVGQVTVESATVTPDSFGGTAVQGTVRNASTRAITFFTQVALAGYDQSGTIADVTFTYVDGVSVSCDSDTSTSGVPPAGTAPYSYFFLHPVTSIGRKFVNWDEFAINPGTASFPSSGGSGNVQVLANCAWSASSDSSWITIVAGSQGVADGAFSYSVAANTQSTIRTGHVVVKGISFTISQAAVTVTAGSAAPFGAVDTPANNATGVTGSIGVTGWALDDAGVTSVRVLRDPVAGETAGQRVFIGNAVLVTGARPDVQAAYPGYPNNSRAGWGYLMLTNVLPNQGDGTFTFYMYADDANGNATLLGARTITCSNSTSTTPFGAIDTPTQGQTVSGSVDNFGWVLSRGATRADPPGGGTVNVVIDGAVVGSPGGWTDRSDITARFPVAQYSGVNTALGVLTFDSTTLTDGVHTIAWGVVDNQGGASGVGSRYFTVANAVASPVRSEITSSRAASPFVALGPVAGRRGYQLDAPFRQYRPDAEGLVTVQAEELDRIELGLNGVTGSLKTARGLEPLPIGSRIDPSSGTFTWQPGVGFVGPYEFVFETAEGRRNVRIKLNPKGSNRVGPQVAIDAPSANQNVARRFIVAGWAADLDSSVDSGVDAIHVWAYPVDGRAAIFLGAATAGGKRPDVRDIYGSQFATSGYGLAVDSLAPGTYDLAVFAWSSVRQGFVPARTVKVTVR